MDHMHEDSLQERTLTVINYGEGEEGEVLRTRVTIAPHAVSFLIASENTVQIIDGSSLRRVNVMLQDGSNLELILTILDLTTLERAIGSYFLP